MPLNINSSSGLNTILNAGGGVRNWINSFTIPDAEESRGAGPAGNGGIGFITSDSSSSSIIPDESYLSNNGLMEYLEGLLASVGQENVENRLFNMNEAQKNRDWQEYMSNTSYQRAVADLQKAGLNPILAYQQGGSSTPSGGSASYNVGAGDTLSSILNSFANLLSSAGEIGNLLAAISLK